MILDIKMLKKVCTLYNRILSVRLNNVSRDVYVRAEKRKVVLAISAESSGKAIPESLFFEYLITWFESMGELCYDKSEIDENDDLIIHLKTVD